MTKTIYEEIGQKLAAEKETTLGNMFGKPCLKVRTKAFAAFFQDEMVFKLGADQIKDLKEKYIGSQNWDPSGKKRAMKDWLQVPGEYSDDWESLARQALGFVEDL